ncbi:hypothetical protein [Streptomyces niger]|uniref:hypothetical protein n=1 Tax=Streptomyces niger TaxID=66373 RepID=UPI00069B81D2|nr:hypothetical protein [Streptomyces niger]
MIRNVIGSLIALIGAAAAVWSPFRPWYDGRHGEDIRVADLFSGFNGISGAGADVMRSLLLPMLVGALLTLLGIVLRSRLLVTLAGLVVLGFTVLWMVRQGQAAGGLTAGSGGRGLGVGVAAAVGGGILLLLAALMMSGRRGVRARKRRREEEQDYEPAPYGGPDDRYAYEGGAPYPYEGGAPYPYEGEPRGGPYAYGERGSPYAYGEQPPGPGPHTGHPDVPYGGPGPLGGAHQEPWPPTHDGTTPPAGTPHIAPQEPRQDGPPPDGPHRDEPAPPTQPLPRIPGDERQQGRDRPPEERPEER